MLKELQPDYSNFCFHGVRLLKETVHPKIKDKYPSSVFLCKLLCFEAISCRDLSFLLFFPNIITLDCSCCGTLSTNKILKRNT